MVGTEIKGMMMKKRNLKVEMWQRQIVKSFRNDKRYSCLVD